ncbi:MAG: nucleoside triphosphate pyrophosphohydrolase [Clostridiales bacterium GWF2_38_85]|nr:MAG: nucleoside triphosphate pyrophosphohydrolase [Clostridiales bacterium GWF2_38_85]HBL83898.1 nucleoside triphosphate pyrophosphohydrolase [Clostridiales bacterium]
MKDKINELLSKNNYSFYDLTSIMEILRAPGGCPWDREQTHKSIRHNLIEETYEAIEAIDTDDNELLCEELGDVILQVVFHSRMAEDEKAFDINNVIDGICKKLIVRHPHVFGDVKADTANEVLINWDTIKQKQKNRKTTTESMQGISRALPALMRATKIGEKAKKVGFDFPDAKSAAAKVSEELNEVLNAKQDTAAEEIGDLLFASVNLARIYGVEPEGALTQASDKFVARFSAMEDCINGEGKSMKDISFEEADKIWDKVKKNTCN